MSWKKVSWCGVEVYVQRLSVIERAKRYFQDIRTQKIKNS